MDRYNGIIDIVREKKNPKLAGPWLVWVLGSLHIRVKIRDHEMVRAQRKVSKGRPYTPPKSCSVVMDPRVSCEVICDRALDQMLFQWFFYSCGSSHMINIINQQLQAFEVRWYYGFVLGLPPRGGFWKQSKWPWNTIRWMPCKNVRTHVDFTSILHSHIYYVGPSSVVWSNELGPDLAFPPMRALEV